MIKLSVNVDKVATLRQSRGGLEPDPVAAALVCEEAGADGITIHLRKDRRHIQDRDVALLRQVVKTELNLEMAVTEEMIGIALKTQPDQCTLVPERSEELTTEDGLDVIAEKERLSEGIERLKGGGMRVSIFSRLNADQIRAAKAIGADRIELFTGAYGNAKTADEEDREFKRVLDAAKLAGKLGLGLNAGHDLNVRNLPRAATIPNLLEVSIGHSLMARALFIGLRGAVQELLAILRR